MNAPWLLDMQWRDVLFAHWRTDAGLLQRTLPAGVTLDCYDDTAWLSVVPFRMSRVRPRGLPVLPGFGDVLEINLRTYVRIGDLRLVWFYSLDAASPIVVRSARTFTGLPYFDATIATSERDGEISYTSRRTGRASSPARFRARYRPQAAVFAAQPGSLPAFLHERYGFVTQRGRALVYGEVRHAPWIMSDATISIADNTLGDTIGHPLPAVPDACFFARGMRVQATAVRRLPA
ncbi:MAG: DUF2071 domain-containing protein [Candidatus Velthaea sp.]